MRARDKFAGHVPPPLAVLVLLNAVIGYGGRGAVPGALLALLIGGSLTITRMGPGFLKLIERKSPAGYIGRWMLVVVVLVPAALHVFQLKTQLPEDQAGVLSLVFSSFVYTMALLVCISSPSRKTGISSSTRSHPAPNCSTASAR